MQRRILWLPYAQRGSLYPIVPVVKHLVMAGAEVTMLAPSRLAPLGARLGVDHRSMRPDIDYDWSHAGTCDRFALGRAAGDRWFHNRLAAEFADVSAEIAAVRPHALLVDSFVVGGGLAAERRNVPWASYVHYLFDEGADVDNMHRIWWERPGEPALRRYCDWWSDLRGSVGLEADSRPVEEAPWYRMSPHTTFLLGHPELRRGAARPLPGYVMRTSLPPWDEPAEVPSLPRLASRLALVANSSSWQDDLALVEAACVGLPGLDVRVIATVAAAHTIGFRWPDGVRLVGYVSHDLLLPEVDIVVSTAGYGLVSKALWYGRPLVLAPLARDQHFVAEAAVAAGVAVTIRWPPSAESVRAAAGEILSSCTYHERACGLAGPLPGYPGPAQVASRILDLT